MKQPTFPRGIDSTMRSSYVNCPKQFFYSYCLRLQQYDSSIHLLAGGAFAAGCEAYRLTYYTEGDNAGDHEEAMAAGLVALIIHWGDKDTYEEVANKSLWMMMLALDEYFKINNPKFDPIQPHFIKAPDGSTKPCVEVNFAIPIAGTLHPENGEEILYVGRYDMVGEFNKQLYVVDEKTASQLGPQWVKQWDLRGQFIGYCWAAREFGIPIAGTLVRGLSILKRSFGSALAIVPVKAWLVDRWHAQLVKDVNRMSESYKTGEFDMNFGDACSAYGGCQFKTLCQSENPEAWYSTYQHNPWNPLMSHEEMLDEKARIDGTTHKQPDPVEGEF